MHPSNSGTSKQINELKNDIQELRRSLNQINDQKEALFQKREKLGKEIISLINITKNIRKKRDELTTSVKEFKGERKKLNEDITKKIDNIKKLNKEKRDLERKKGIKENPSQLKREIEGIDFKIETSALSFDKEQKLMKYQKELKKKFKELTAMSGVWESTHGLSKEIDEEKKKADSFHKQIQDLAKDSQEKHETSIENSKKIQGLKEEEEKVKKEITEKKETIHRINEELKDKLQKLGKIDSTFKEERKVHREKTDRQKKTTIKDKQREVEQKIAKGEKLTTEDLLVMQNI